MYKFKTICHLNHDTQGPLLQLTNRDGNTYLFGKIPEGTQRVLNENKAKFGRMKLVFFTGIFTKWHDIGGLPGFLLTLSDATKKGIQLFVGSLTLFHYIISNWRYFVFRKGIDLEIEEVGSKKDVLLGDNNISVTTIKVVPEHATPVSDVWAKGLEGVATRMFPKDTLGVNLDDPELYKVDYSEREHHTHIGLPNPMEIVATDHQPLVSYIIRLLPMRGKFDMKKAKELGLKPSKEFKRLEQGEAIPNENGDLIYPHQVMSAPMTFPKVAVIDIPNSAYLGATINDRRWFEVSKDLPEPIKVVYHFLGEDVDYESQPYQQFLGKFASDTNHFISHPKLSDNTLVFKLSAGNVLKLRHLLPHNITLPYIENFSPLAGDRFHKLQLLQEVMISPDVVEINHNEVVSGDWNHHYNEVIETPQDDREKVIDPTPIPIDRAITSTTTLSDLVQVVTLGTGSALPSLYRNVTLTLVRVPHQKENGDISHTLVLLDGGENTFGTMLRTFGHNNNAQLDTILRELKLIHLSHLHADHHLGLVSVISRWFDLNPEGTLYLVLPWQFDIFLREWYALEKQDSQIDLSRLVYISCEDFLDLARKPQFIQTPLEQFNGQLPTRRKLEPVDEHGISKMMEDVHLTKVDTVRAIHCPWAYLIAMTFDLGDNQVFKVAYSGDTRPNPSFVEIGKNSNLLIHESSLDNDLIEEAIAKKHSTMIEAVAVCQLMDCPKLMLTHFLTRYAGVGNIAGSLEMKRLADELLQYLKSLAQKGVVNIFDSDKPMRPVEDVEICFAFDTLTLYLDEMGCQRPIYGDLVKLLNLEEIDEEKAEKIDQKRKEKQEAKRDKRLNKRQKTPTDV